METQDFNSQLTSLQDNLKYFAKSLTQNDEEANDLVQDTFLKALTYRDKFEQNTNLKAWTYTIMKNTFINNYRRNAKVGMVIDNTADLYYLNAGKNSDENNPDTVLAHKDINKVVDRLEDEHRIPFQMHHTGYKYKEIAEKLDLSIGTVKSRIFFSRKKLMTSLKNHV
jgi:RNA polymerase sigma factor (sigma-70 family)